MPKIFMPVRTGMNISRRRWMQQRLTQRACMYGEAPGAPTLGAGCLPKYSTRRPLILGATIELILNVKIVVWVRGRGVVPKVPTS